MNELLNHFHNATGKDILVDVLLFAAFCCLAKMFMLAREMRQIMLKMIDRGIWWN